MKETWSNYPLRSLGWASDGEVLLAEEDRESHIHILGAPGEGKSKLLELLIDQDIDAGYGACLLDSSDNGDTAYKILKYCAKIGFTKVCLIDPHDDIVCTINPIHSKAPSAVVASNIMDTFRVLWGNKSYEETPKIQKYLPAIIKTLHAGGHTLHEALYFTDQLQPVYKSRRNDILQSLHALDTSRVALENAFNFSNRSQFNLEFDSTVRRLNPLFDDKMKLIIGSNKSPLNFMKMISENWLILVNLDSTGVWGTEQQRLLGTLVINEVIYAIHRLNSSGWRGVYYLYIDEVGDYATPKLAYVLDKKRKTGLRFCVAHQRFNQIEDTNVLSAIKGSTKIKVLFNTPNRQDRDEMIRMMYGGELSDRAVSYELMNSQKQHAAIKINKNPPRVTRIRDLPDVQISKEALKAFKDKLYIQPWYRTRKEVLNEINARFTKSKSTSSPERPFGDQTVESTSGNGRKGKDKSGPHARNRGTVSNNKTGSEDVLLSKKGRNTRKAPPSKPKGQ